VADGTETGVTAIPNWPHSVVSNVATLAEYGSVVLYLIVSVTGTVGIFQSVS